MRCPDENYFARLGEGQLTEHELADFHRHVDHCAECFEMAALLGCVGAANDAPQSESSRGSSVERPASAHVTMTQRAWSVRAIRERAPQRWGAVALTLLAHLYFSYVFVPLAWQKMFAEHQRDAVGLVLASGILFLGIAGLAFGVVALGGWLMGASWGPRALRGYLASSLATLSLGPLSLCAWYLIRGGLRSSTIDADL